MRVAGQNRHDPPHRRRLAVRVVGIAVVEDEMLGRAVVRQVRAEGVVSLLSRSAPECRRASEEGNYQDSRERSTCEPRAGHLITWISGWVASSVWVKT